MAISTHNLNPTRDHIVDANMQGGKDSQKSIFTEPDVARPPILPGYMRSVEQESFEREYSVGQSEHEDLNP
jgi:hypothetical protein